MKRPVLLLATLSAVEEHLAAAACGYWKVSSEAEGRQRRREREKEGGRTEDELTSEKLVEREHLLAATARALDHIAPPVVARWTVLEPKYRVAVTGGVAEIMNESIKHVAVFLAKSGHEVGAREVKDERFGGGKRSRRGIVELEESGSDLRLLRGGVGSSNPVNWDVGRLVWSACTCREIESGQESSQRLRERYCRSSPVRSG
jgi:hypothetical protein